MTSEEAKEIVALPVAYIIENGLSDSAFEARGFLEGMQASEVKALVEALYEANTKHMSYCDIYTVSGSNNCTCELQKRRDAFAAYEEATKRSITPK